MYLLLSSLRKGRYSGKVLVINERNDHRIRYEKFLAEFGEVNDLLPLYVDMSECVFPEPGHYNFEVYFTARDGGEVLKGEHLFNVLPLEE